MSKSTRILFGGVGVRGRVCVGECACVFQGAKGRKGKGETGRLLKTIITQNITINMKFSMLQRKKTIQIPERLVLPNAAFPKLRI